MRRRAELNKKNNKKGWTKPPTPNQVKENNEDKTEASTTKYSPKPKTNQIRLKLREPKLEMPRKKTKLPKGGKATKQSHKIGLRILAVLNSTAKIRNLLWYVLLVLTIFIQRTHAMVFLHPMLMPLAMSPSLHRLLHPGMYNSSRGLTAIPLPENHTAITWKTTASRTPLLSSSVETPTYLGASMEVPTYLGSSVEVPTYLPGLFAIGTMFIVLTGAAAMLYCFLRRLTTPSPPAYEILDEDLDLHKNQIEIIMSKAVHVRTPLERLAVNRWAKQQNSN